MGFSPVRISDHRNAHAVIQALAQNDFLLVKNLYNQYIHAQNHASTQRDFQVSLCHGVKLLQWLNPLSMSQAIPHCLKASQKSIVL